MTLPRLLALDLDGTLLGRGDAIGDDDRAALAAARRAGIQVTLATGRITTGALPTARALELRGTMVVADGAVLADMEHGTPTDTRWMPPLVVEGLTSTMRAQALQAFWFLHDEIHGEHGSDAVVGYVRTWSPDVRLHPVLADAPVQSRRHEVAATVGVGPRAAVERAAEWLAETHPGALNAAHFPLDRDRWALLARDATADKAQGLARLCAPLGIARHEVAVVGDWINDVPMFRWAGRSFAMGGAPDDVARHATDRLTRTVRDGGVAEAVRHILRGHS